MNLSQVLGEHYYALISKDVRAYYSGKTKVSPNTFDLYDRLRDLQEVLGIERYYSFSLNVLRPAVQATWKAATSHFLGL